jgi:hypothetical protein
MLGKPLAWQDGGRIRIGGGGGGVGAGAEAVRGGGHAKGEQEREKCFHGDILASFNCGCNAALREFVMTA